MTVIQPRQQRFIAVLRRPLSERMIGRLEAAVVGNVLAQRLSTFQLRTCTPRYSTHSSSYLQQHSTAGHTAAAATTTNTTTTTVTVGFSLTGLFFSDVK